MKLVKAKVENFRCVEDSTEFRIDDGATCLVGKNESGKTSLLTALYRLNPVLSGDASFNALKEYPRRFFSDFEQRHPKNSAPVVTTWWKLDDDEKSRVDATFGPEALKTDTIVAIRGYNVFSRSCPLDEARIVARLVDDGGLHDEEKKAVGVVSSIAEFRKRVSELPEGSQRHADLVQRIDTQFPGGSVPQAFWTAFELPKFMLFSHYQRMQGQVSLEQIRQRQGASSLDDDDRVFLALCEMAGTTVDAVAQIQQFEDLVSRFEGASNKISGEIFRYWTQNRHLKVQFRLDSALPADPPPFNGGRIFRTRILNQLHEATVPFDERSTGFVWFFSFLALFSQVKKSHNGKLILLLDEPGLSLHGKAQADLLRYFQERLVPNHQVIYTTHSPFMVSPDRLLSVRTVEDLVVQKDGEPPVVHGTKVGDDILSTDKDTLFPLQAALGYEITQSLFVGKDTILVEGPSDILFLKAMSESLRANGRQHLDKRWTLCPAGGIDKVGAFMSLFGGNRLHVAVLVDFALGHKKKVEDLRRSKLLKQGHVFTAETYAGQSEADVEDILGAELYVALVNTTYGLKGQQVASPATSNSRVVKQVEDHFRTLVGLPEFDHFAPSAYLLENRTAFLKKAPGVGDAMDRFERLFIDLNALLL